jgi:hypothetical protein
MIEGVHHFCLDGTMHASSRDTNLQRDKAGLWTLINSMR